MTDRISAEDRATALGRLFRGIAHETANALNAILMNAQLGTLNPDEAQASLQTVIQQARSGGEFLKRMSAFAGANTLAPHTDASLSDCLGLARKLLGSRVRRSGLKLTIELGDAPDIPLDPFAVAATIALLIDYACELAPAEATLRMARTTPACVLEMHLDGRTWQPDENRLALRFARQLAADHGGSFETMEAGWRLTLPRGGGA